MSDKELIVRDLNEILVNEFCTDWKEKRLYIELLIRVTHFDYLLNYIQEKDKEIERLNNNWNDLEKYTKEEIKKWKEEEKIENDYSTRANILGYITGMENVQDKMEELKGVDKE